MGEPAPPGVAAPKSAREPVMDDRGHARPTWEQDIPTKRNMFNERIEQMRPDRKLS